MSTPSDTPADPLTTIQFHATLLLNHVRTFRADAERYAAVQHQVLLAGYEDSRRECDLIKNERDKLKKELEDSKKINEELSRLFDLQKHRTIESNTTSTSQIVSYRPSVSHVGVQTDPPTTHHYTSVGKVPHVPQPSTQQISAIPEVASRKRTRSQLEDAESNSEHEGHDHEDQLAGISIPSKLDGPDHWLANPKIRSLLQRYYFYLTCNQLYDMGTKYRTTTLRTAKSSELSDPAITHTNKPNTSHPPEDTDSDVIPCRFTSISRSRRFGVKRPHLTGNTAQTVNIECLRFIPFCYLSVSQPKNMTEVVIVKNPGKVKVKQTKKCSGTFTGPITEVDGARFVGEVAVMLERIHTAVRVVGSSVVASVSSSSGTQDTNGEVLALVQLVGECAGLKAQTCLYVPMECLCRIGSTQEGSQVASQQQHQVG